MQMRSTRLVEILGVGSKPSSIKKLSTSCGRDSSAVLSISASASLSPRPGQQCLSSVPAGPRQSPPLLLPLLLLATLVLKTLVGSRLQNQEADGKRLT